MTPEHILGDSGLGDIDRELQQLTMNTWRAPQRVIADLCRDPGSADTTTARLPAPVETEAAPLPAHQRLGLDDDFGSEQRGEQPIEPDEDQTICIPQPEPRWCGSLQDQKLVAEEMPPRLREPPVI
jgi:hypothetical protein